VAGYDYRRVEGILYDLSGDAEARPARPHVGVPSTSPRQTGAPPREAVTRLDVALAVRDLPPEDRDVIERHYLRGARVPYRQRTHAVRRLVTLLGSLDSADA
jgi:hypothetical protein